MHTATTVLVCTAALGALVFVIRYLLTSWFSTPMGRHAMAFMVVVLIVLGLAVSYELFGDWLGQDTARLISYSMINAVLWWRVYLLFSGQHAARKRGDQRNHVS